MLDNTCYTMNCTVLYGKSIYEELDVFILKFRKIYLVVYVRKRGADIVVFVGVSHKELPF